MATSLIAPERIRALNDRGAGGGSHVLYWMQAAVRTRDNHALEFAARAANDLGLPLVVGFGLDADYREASERTLRFLIDGLVAVAPALERRGIGFVVRAGHPAEVAAALADDAAALVTDVNYLREPRRWRRELAARASIPVWEVETNAVVPVEVASDGREWAARTLRPKIHEHLDRFLVELRTTPLARPCRSHPDGIDTGSPEPLLDAVGLGPIDEAPHRGGQSQAYAALTRFIDEGLPRYGKNDTAVDGSCGSRLSMYLHYGHISPVEVARRARAAQAPAGAIDAFIEELVVRRELAHNYVWFEPDYDAYRALPDWARTTLEEHRDDDREHGYTRAQLKDAATHDPYWNAAMIEMRETGWLHNRMRMYWGKRILEWTNTPEYAFRVALELNNRYLLDGRDPNSYASIAWLFGLHDQAFAERRVIGKVRPMTPGGLERKIDVRGYVEDVRRRTGHDPE